MSFCNFKTDNSEDDDDFIIDDGFSSEEFRTNSSSSSLKWSVDARRQNEEDWLSIERILYREESLPEGLNFPKYYRFSHANKVVCSSNKDEKTREEFQGWMRAFPHLR